MGSMSALHIADAISDYSERPSPLLGVVIFSISVACSVLCGGWPIQAFFWLEWGNSRDSTQRQSPKQLLKMLPGAPEPALSLSKGLASETWDSILHPQQGKTALMSCN